MSERNLQRLKPTITEEQFNGVKEILDLINQEKDGHEGHQIEISNGNDSERNLEKIRNGRRGNGRYNIDKNLLEHFLFHWAALLQVLPKRDCWGQKSIQYFVPVYEKRLEHALLHLMTLNSYRSSNL